MSRDMYLDSGSKKTKECTDTLERIEVILDQSEGCPCCGSQEMSIFYKVKDVPVHSVLLMDSRKTALNYPRADIELGFCHGCGFVWNTVFKPQMLEYCDRCEESQGFSETFNAFHRRLAEHLTKRYELHNKDIIEIGCGKGEFLNMLCELGDNRGVGFDPAYVQGRNDSKAKENVTFIKDFYSAKYRDHKADFICCKMTLEHICQAGAFIRMVRESILDHLDTMVFFQVPDVVRVLRETAFWDVYYEHCSYFCQVSLSRLFESCGFEVLNTWCDYGGQYLMIEAKPCRVGSRQLPLKSDGVKKVAKDVTFFFNDCPSRQKMWRQYLYDIRQNKKRVVLWGSGSKAVSFLTTLNVSDQIEYVVDINLYRQGTFIAGTGQEIVSPKFLAKYKPDDVIVMNPVYKDEIGQSLAELGIDCQLLTV